MLQDRESYEGSRGQAKALFGGNLSDEDSSVLLGINVALNTEGGRRGADKLLTFSEGLFYTESDVIANLGSGTQSSLFNIYSKKLEENESPTDYGTIEKVQEIFNSRVGKIISNQLLSIIFIEEKSVFTRKAIINVPFYVIMLLRREKVVGRYTRCKV